MAGYAVVNLKQVEDGAARFGLAPAMEARFARRDIGCERTGVSYQRLASGARQAFAHRHGSDEEVYVVVAGSGQLRLGDDVVDVGRWDAVRVAPETVRMFSAGPDGLEWLAFGEHREGDAEMLPAEWPGE